MIHNCKRLLAIKDIPPQFPRLGTQCPVSLSVCMCSMLLCVSLLTCAIYPLLCSYAALVALTSCCVLVCAFICAIVKVPSFLSYILFQLGCYEYVLPCILCVCTLYVNPRLFCVSPRLNRSVFSAHSHSLCMIPRVRYRLLLNTHQNH